MEKTACYGQECLRLSIIVPMYNVDRFIRRCLESCYNQHLEEEEFEIIIIDDGSIDASAKVVKEIEKQHSNIKYLYQENQGQGAARNLGLTEAKGKYILFVDADDYLLPDTIQQVLDIAEANAADIVRFRMEAEQADGSLTSDSYSGEILNRSFKGEDVLFFLSDIGSVCDAVYLRQFICEHHFRFRTDIKHEDVAFCYDVYPEARSFVFCNACCYHYCYHIGSTDRTHDKEKQKRLIYSDLCIARALKDKTKEGHLSEKIKAHFLKKSNSMQVSVFLMVLRCDYYPWKEYVLNLKALGLLPITGRTQSLRTTLLIPFVNIVCRFFSR